jgi:YegS/Rv2252/BmrU family lipid kinase
VITLILNPAAGVKRHDDLPGHLTDLFRAAGAPMQIAPFGSAEDVAKTVRSAARDGADAVVAGGGDGTVSTVAGALVGTETPLGVLPLGTLNHFARDLGIPHDLAAAVKTIAARRTIKVDAGEVNSRVFINNSSIGIYPDIVLERDALRRQGYRKLTAFLIASSKVVRNYRSLVVKITADHSAGAARTPFLLVGNNEYQTDGIHLGARSRLDGGRLSAYLAPRVHARELPKLLVWALTGRARTNHALESVDARELLVETPGRHHLRVALDGEVVSMRAPLHYRVRPLALRVIVP